MQFEPDELDELKAIFDEITAQPWFDPADKEAFARHLIQTYPNEAFDAKRLEELARMLYCNKVA